MLWTAPSAHKSNAMKMVPQQGPDGDLEKVSGLVPEKAGSVPIGRALVAPLNPEVSDAI